jgi:hypothetical protein
MKLEIVFILIVGILIYDTYHGGVVMKYFNTCKKYYKLAGVIFLIFSIYITIKKDPIHIRDMLIQATNGRLQNGSMYKNQKNPSVLNLHNPPIPVETPVVVPVSTKPATKRSVSETKKKFVASQQEWKCKNCNMMLTAWFEVDHVVRLEYGGSNEVSNLVALCRECHGKKTAIENM